MQTVIIDFETRSKADIRHGAFEYASHISTEILCMAWCYLENDDAPEIWGFLPELVGVTEKRVKVNTQDGSEKYRKVKIDKWAFKEHNLDGLKKLFQKVKDGEVRLEAHNHAFEYYIWNITGCKYGFPKTPAIDDSNFWSCSAARAAASGLPRALEDVAKAVDLDIEKDSEGHKVMLQLCKPRKATISNPDEYYNDKERFERLFKYCKTDVEVERKVSRMIPDLDHVGPLEKKVWALDSKINDRGVLVDRETCKIISSLIEEGESRASTELYELTGGQVNAVSEVKSLTDWISSQGVTCNSVSKDAIEGMLLSDIPEVVRRVLEIRKSAGRSSLAKFDRLIKSTEGDGRLRGNLLYYGAATGRWAGKGVQLQNLPRGSVSDVMSLVTDIANLSYNALESKYGDVFEALSSAIRPMLMAEEGRKFIFSDFSSIECRVLPWLAKDKDTLRLFRDNVDLYKEMAVDIYSVPYDKVTKDQRQIGKMAILGLGYSMGVDKFYEAMLLQRISGASRELAELAVTKYRDRFHLIKNLWYQTERAAIRAFNNPGNTTSAGLIRFWRRSSTSALYMILPSGRRICFFKPELVDTKTPWGEKRKQLKYKRQIATAGMKFTGSRTYGGDLVQTATQAVARDLMAGAMINLEDWGYEILLTVHDEIVASVPDNPLFSKEEMVKIMTTPPKWGKNIPIAAEGQECARYHK